MESSRRCPSFPIPGAWPSPDQQDSDSSESYHLCSYQHQSEPHWYHGPVHGSKPVLETSPTADDALISLTTNDNSFFSEADTSFLSAYTKPTPLEFSPSSVKLQNGIKSDPRQQCLHDNSQPSPRQGEADRLLITNQIIRSVPETLDPPSLSLPGVRPPISQEGGALAVQYPSRQCLDGSLSGERAPSFETNSFDIPSPSSIRFLPARVPAPSSPLETSIEPFRFPQTDVHDSWVSIPRFASLHPWESLLSGATRTPSDLTGEISEHRSASMTWTNSRRSWRLDDSLPHVQLQQEDLSATLYANDVLERMFNMGSGESCFALEPFDTGQDNTTAHPSSGYPFPLPVLSSIAIKRPRVRILHMTGKKIRRIFMKFKIKHREEPVGLQGESASHSERSLFPVQSGERCPASRIIVTTGACMLPLPLNRADNHNLTSFAQPLH